MTIRLHPLQQKDFSTWFESAVAEYARDLLATGLAAELAREQARTKLTGYFPQGEPLAGHVVFTIVDGEENQVGYFWIGPDTSDNPAAWWVWDIFVAPAERGLGYGRAAMILGEKYARSQGAATLGLNVFGANRSAQALYLSLGFEITNIQMRKEL